MILNLLQDAKIVKCFNGAVAGTTAQSSSTVALNNFDSVLMVVDVGAVTSGAIMQLNAFDGAQSGGGDAAQMVNPAGANIQTAALTDAGTNSNKIFLLDVHRPLKAFMTVNFTRTTQNVVINSMWMIFYNTHQKPFGTPTSILTAATQDTSVAASAQFIANS